MSQGCEFHDKAVERFFFGWSIASDLVSMAWQANLNEEFWQLLRISQRNS